MAAPPSVWRREGGCRCALPGMPTSDGLRQVEYEVAVGVAIVPRAGLEELLLDAEYRRGIDGRCRRIDPDADDSAEQCVVARRCGAFERDSPVA